MKNGTQTTDYTKFSPEDLIKELLASQKAAGDNKDMAELLEKEVTTLKETESDLKHKVDILTEENADLKTENEALTSENTDLKTQVAELQEELLEEQQDNPNRKESFEIDGKKYEVLVKSAIVPGFGVLTALDICASPEAQKKLVEKKSSLIKEVK